MSSLDTDALYVALDRKRRTERISWREVVRQAGIAGASTTSRLAHDQPPSADNLIRLLLWLGNTDLEPFIRGDAR